MAIVFMGGEMSGLTPSDSATVEVTTSGYFDTGFCRCAISCHSTSSYAECDPAGTLTEAWAHFDARVNANAPTNGGTTVYPLLVWLDGSGTERVRITHRLDSNAFFTLQYDVGAGWVTAGSAITLNIRAALQTIDLRAVVNSGTGSLTLYVGGTERITSGSLDLSAITELNKVRFYGTTIGVLNFSAYISQVILASESTIGMKLMTGYPSGNGASTAWGGDYASVDEAVNSDADFIYSDTNGQRETFAMTLVGSVSGYTPRAVSVCARAKRGSSGPANLQLTVYTASTNYDSSSIALGLGYAGTCNVWEDNPNTTADWSSTEASTIQIGVEANT